MLVHARAASDATAALDRLYRKNVVTLEEAQSAARLLTGDPNVVFPPPGPPSAPTAPSERKQPPEVPAAAPLPASEAAPPEGSSPE